MQYVKIVPLYHTINDFLFNFLTVFRGIMHREQASDVYVIWRVQENERLPLINGCSLVWSGQVSPLLLRSRKSSLHSKYSIHRLTYIFIEVGCDSSCIEYIKCLKCYVLCIR